MPAARMHPDEVDVDASLIDVMVACKALPANAREIFRAEPRVGEATWAR